MTITGVEAPLRHVGGSLLATQSDKRLIELVRGGHEPAFEAIVHRYRGPLLRQCSRVLPASRAEDAVQQTLVKAHHALGRSDGELNLRPWLFRIARNTSLNMLRENGWSHEALDERVDGVEQPYEALQRRERLRGVVTAIQRLPRRQRDALVMRELEGRRYDEIARALTVSEGSVRMLLNRARTNLGAGLSALAPPWLLTRLGVGDDGGASAAVTGAAAGLTGFVKLSAGILVGGALVVGGGGFLHGITHLAHHPRTARLGRPAAHSSSASVAGTQNPGAGRRSASAHGSASAGRHSLLRSPPAPSGQATGPSHPQASGDSPPGSESAAPSGASSDSRSTRDHSGPGQGSDSSDSGSGSGDSSGIGASSGDTSGSGRSSGGDGASGRSTSSESSDSGSSGEGRGTSQTAAGETRH